MNCKIQRLIVKLAFLMILIIDCIVFLFILIGRTNGHTTEETFHLINV